MKTIEIYKGIEIKFGFNGVYSSSTGTGMNKGRTFKNKLSSLIYELNGKVYGFSFIGKDYSDYLPVLKKEIDNKIG